MLQIAEISRISAKERKKTGLVDGVADVSFRGSSGLQEVAPRENFSYCLRL